MNSWIIKTVDKIALNNLLEHNFKHISSNYFKIPDGRSYKCTKCKQYIIISKCDFKHKNIEWEFLENCDEAVMELALK